MDGVDEVRARWAAGLRAAAERAYAAGHGAEPPEPLPTRWRLDARTAVTAATVVLLLAAVVWWGLRPAPVSVPLTTVTPEASSASVTPSASAASTVLVHVSGAVNRPGIVELPAGARVADAITAAGGLTRRGDESSVNLARLLVDGEQVLVSRRGEAPAASAGQSRPATVNLNTADAVALEALPGVGPVLAARIVADREAHGPFRTLEDLDRVPGVGPAILGALGDLATT